MLTIKDDQTKNIQWETVSADNFEFPSTAPLQLCVYFGDILYAEDIKLAKLNHYNY